MWNGNWSTAIYHLAALDPKPKYLVINAGAHKHDLNSPVVRAAIQKALNETGIIGIYKLTTFGRGGFEEGKRWKYHEKAMCELMDKRCLDYTWTRNLTKKSFTDHIHMYVNSRCSGCVNLLTCLACVPMNVASAQQEE